MRYLLALIIGFFRPAALDFGQAFGGAAAGLTDLYNANRLPQYQGFVPYGGVSADQTWVAAMQAIQAATDRNTGLVNPVILQSYSRMLGIDLSGLISSGQKAGQQYGGLSDVAQGYAGATGAQGLDQFAAGKDIYALGRDPQSALHDKLKGEVTDDVRAAQAARGIGMSPYSAGQETDALDTFEQNWQKNLLGRTATGLQGMNAADFYGGINLGRSMDFGAQSPGYTQLAAQAPIAGQVQAYGMPMDFSSMFTGAQQQNVLSPYYNMQGAIDPYLNMAGGFGGEQSQYALRRALAQNQMQVQGAGMINTGYGSGLTGNASWGSGIGQPQNWYFGGMGVGGGGGGGMTGMGIG